MVTGSPGGPRIISTTLLTIVNVIDWKMDPRQAVSAPRFHHQWDPNRVEVEPSVAEDVVQGLKKKGHDVLRSPRTWSAAEVIVIDPVSGLHLGGADPRTDGAGLVFLTPLPATNLDITALLCLAFLKLFAI